MRYRKKAITLEDIAKLEAEMDECEKAQREMEEAMQQEFLRLRKDCKHTKTHGIRLEYSVPFEEAITKGVKYQEIVYCKRCNKQMSKKTYVCKHPRGFRTHNSKLGKNRSMVMKIFICRDCGYITAHNPKESLNVKKQ